MKKFVVILIVFGISVPFLKAQDTISKSHTDTTDASSSVLNDFFAYYILKNRKTEPSVSRWNMEVFLGFGFLLGDIKNNSASLVYGSSCYADYGFKGVYKVSPIYSATFGLGITFNFFRIKNGIENGMLNFAPFTPSDPNYVMNKESYATMNFYLFAGNRLYFGPKSKAFVELGIYGGYDLLRNYTLSFYGPSEMKGDFVYSNPSAFVPFDAGIQVNLAPLRWLSLCGRYRLTNCFYSSFSNAELPRFSVGLFLNTF